MLLIVCATVLCIVLGVVIVVQRFRITQLKESLYGEKLKVKHANRQKALASQHASELETRCAAIAGQLDSSIANTGHALSRAQVIEYVSQQLRELTDYAGLTVAPAPSRHALPREAPAPPNLIPHMHVGHQQGVPSNPDTEAVPEYQNDAAMPDYDGMPDQDGAEPVYDDEPEPVYDEEPMPGYDGEMPWQGATIAGGTINYVFSDTEAR